MHSGRFANVKNKCKCWKFNSILNIPYIFVYFVKVPDFSSYAYFSTLIQPEATLLSLAEKIWTNILKVKCIPHVLNHFSDFDSVYYTHNIHDTASCLTMTCVYDMFFRVFWKFYFSNPTYAIMLNYLKIS